MPNIPPSVATDIALPLSIKKYLAIEVEPACVIAPFPKKRNKNKHPTQSPHQIQPEASPVSRKQRSNPFASQAIT